MRSMVTHAVPSIAAIETVVEHRQMKIALKILVQQMISRQLDLLAGGKVQTGDILLSYIVRRKTGAL